MTEPTVESEFNLRVRAEDELYRYKTKCEVLEVVMQLERNSVLLAHECTAIALAQADRRLEMLRAAHLHMVAIGEHNYCNHHDEECLICNIAKELSDE